MVKTNDSAPNHRNCTLEASNTTPSTAATIGAKQLIERFEGFLIDAYGVLVEGGGVIDGSHQFIDLLREQKKPFTLLSNDATHTKDSTLKKYQNMGFQLEDQHILTSGMMIKPYVIENNLEGSNAILLGPPESRQLAFEAGLELPALGSTNEIETIIICDERQELLIENLNWIASLILNSDHSKNLPRIVIANPDLLYPVQGGNFGFTAGSLGVMIESWATLAFGNDWGESTILGKPSVGIFETALERINCQKPLMIGDQIKTDILGARRSNLPSCLSLMGLTKKVEDWHEVKPDWILKDWSELQK